jgi:uncharacterized protein
MNRTTLILCILIALVSGVGIFSYAEKQKREAGTVLAAQPVLQHGAALQSKPVLSVGGHQFYVDLADTDEERRQGLSGRESLSETDAMLFVFDADGRYSFWMKDMLIPIDMIWLDSGKRIVHIERNVPAESYPQTYGPSSPTRYVLEVQAGMADKLKLKANDKAEW